MADAASGILLHGVDFSGAESGGSAKIRVVTRDLGQRSEPVRSEGRFDRRSLARAILASAQDGRAHLWRVDAPQGLPLSTIAELELPADWRAVADSMLAQGSPRHWRHSVRERTRREPRRRCDQELHTPMAPMNLRVFKQTWSFVCELLLPLADAGVRVEPVAGPLGARVVVCEGCPASVLRAHDWPHRGYKGAGAPPAAVRGEIVRRLRALGLAIPEPLAQEAVRDEEGDLLDALLLTTAPMHTVVPAEAIVEGWVY
ncbi:MAG: hypothetical protein U0625_07165 [Phycisphaerales bacterium]